VVEGDTVEEVLSYVQYPKKYLTTRMRQANEEALRRGLLTFEESALLMRRFEEGLAGYTYLEEEDPPTRYTNGTSGHLSASASEAPPLQPEPQKRS
jgi:arginine decarboxylase